MSTEFIWHVSPKDQIPLPGMTISIWAGYDEPKIKAAIVHVERLRDREDHFYRLVLTTNDLRMEQAKKDCEHPSVQAGVCSKCGILVAEETPEK